MIGAPQAYEDMSQAFPTQRPYAAPPQQPPPMNPMSPIGPGDALFSGGLHQGQQRDFAGQPLPPGSNSGDKMDRFRAQFWKTQMCRFYKSGCRNGDNCNYAHGNQELGDRPDLTKTSICKKWESGACMLPAAECVFAHGQNDLKTTPSFEKERRNAGSSQHMKDRNLPRQFPDWPSAAPNAHDQVAGRLPQGGPRNRPPNAPVAPALNEHGPFQWQAPFAGHVSASSASSMQPQVPLPAQPSPFPEQQRTRWPQQDRAPPGVSPPGVFPQDPRVQFPRNSYPPGNVEAYAKPPTTGMDPHSMGRAPVINPHSAMDYSALNLRWPQEVQPPRGIPPPPPMPIGHGSPPGNNQRRKPSGSNHRSQRSLQNNDAEFHVEPNDPRPYNHGIIGTPFKMKQDIELDEDPSDIVDLDSYHNAKGAQESSRTGPFAQTLPDRGPDTQSAFVPASSPHDPAAVPAVTTSSPGLMDVSRTLVQDWLIQAAPDHYDD